MRGYGRCLYILNGPFPKAAKNFLISSSGLSRSYISPFHLVQRSSVRFLSHDSDRISRLSTLIKEPYPRQGNHASQITCKNFIERYSKLDWSDSAQDIVVLHGRISSKRTAGNRLVFIDIVENGCLVQALCNFRHINASTPQDFKAFFQELRRGDIIRLTGTPRVTSAGELSILLRKLPELLSPCLHVLPMEIRDPETRSRNRSTDFLVNSKSAHLLRAKSEVIQYIRRFLLDDDQLEVQTPILADVAGGAVARPFVTTAMEFSQRKISLRIAPELWLKRMVVGGFDRVFEIGPSFRNEGIDPLHNPEFTTCEFYRAYTDLEGLMHLTESLVAGLARHLTMINKKLVGLSASNASFEKPFRKLDFILEVEKALNRPLPNLAEPNAVEELIQTFADYSLPMPPDLTLPKLLDRLSSIFIEPQCVGPTFVVHHPECLSPLSKSFEYPSFHGQRVAARAELFVNGIELANMYEEENSPFEQRRKFTEQLRHRDKSADHQSSVDEQYIDALEWGLPPVGGWGCGIERLCMVLTGTGRIGEVLSFGTLRNVIARAQ